MSFYDVNYFAIDRRMKYSPIPDIDKKQNGEFIISPSNKIR